MPAGPVGWRRDKVPSTLRLVNAIGRQTGATSAVPVFPEPMVKATDGTGDSGGQVTQSGASGLTSAWPCCVSFSFSPSWTTRSSVHAVQCAVGSARRGHPAAVGGERVCTGLRQPHAYVRHARRPLRSQEAHAHRRGDLLRRIIDRRSGSEYATLIAGPSGYGDRRGGVGAGNPFNDPPSLPRTAGASSGPRDLGSCLRARAWPSGRSSEASWSACGRGTRCSGSTSSSG